MLCLFFLTLCTMRTLLEVDCKATLFFANVRGLPAEVLEPMSKRQARLRSPDR